jgi:hypothetical protein
VSPKPESNIYLPEQGAGYGTDSAQDGNLSSCGETYQTGASDIGREVHATHLARLAQPSYFIGQTNGDILYCLDGSQTQSSIPARFLEDALSSQTQRSSDEKQR